MLHDLAPESAVSYLKLIWYAPGSMTTQLPRAIRIFGTGRFASDLAKAVEKHGTEILGFVQTTPSAPSFQGRPIAALNSFSANDETPLFIGIYNYTPSADYGALGASLAPHFRNVVYPMAFYPGLAAELGPRYWLDAKPSAEALKVSKLFADDQSKALLAQIVKFRQGDAGAMKNTLTPGPQYFIPEVIKALPERVRWVDAGAFDGDTLVESVKHFKTASVTAFEPDPANLEKLRKHVAALDLPLWVLPLGVSDRSGMVSFEAGQGGASSTVFGEGSMTIALAKLDDVLPTQKIDFLKIDVEGADLDVVHGAKGILERSQPVIAMAAYHAPEHLHQVPELLHQVLPKHRILLRSHASNTFDTICYAIP